MFTHYCIFFVFIIAVDSQAVTTATVTINMDTREIHLQIREGPSYNFISLDGQGSIIPEELLYSFDGKLEGDEKGVISINFCYNFQGGLQFKTDGNLVFSNRQQTIRLISEVTETENLLIFYVSLHNTYVVKEATEITTLSTWLDLASIIINKNTRTIYMRINDGSNYTFTKLPPRRLGDVIPKDLPYTFRGKLDNGDNGLIIISLWHNSEEVLVFDEDGFIKVPGRRQTLKLVGSVVETENQLKFQVSFHNLILNFGDDTIEVPYELSDDSH